MSIDKTKREFKYGMKPCNVTCCPSYNEGVCKDYMLNCEQVSNCVIKRLLLIPYNRMKYVQHKLSGCLGYNEEQKKIRYEELSYCIDEMLRELEVENGFVELD